MGKNSEVPKLLLVLILVVLLAFVGYNFLYVPQREKLDKLVEENFELEKNMIILQNKTRDEAMYKEKINASKEAMTEVMNRYAAGHTPEKSIMLVDTMVNEIGIELPNINFGSPSALTNVQMPIVKSTEGETGEASYTVDYYNVGITSESLSMSYKCTYEQMKKFVRMAKKELIVIDPYFDDSVLPLIAQKRKGVSVLVVKSPQNRKLHAVDVAKFNAQYANSLTIKDSIRFHDRFLIIDQTTLIHVGASLNYLGKRCFAFSSLDKSNIPDILAKI